jgi:hypothetical protein
LIWVLDFIYMAPFTFTLFAPYNKQAALRVWFNKLYLFIYFDFFNRWKMPMFECLVLIFVSWLKAIWILIFWKNLVMEKDESDGYFRATLDLADGIFHYQFKSNTFQTNNKLIYSSMFSSNKILVWTRTRTCLTKLRWWWI